MNAVNLTAGAAELADLGGYASGAEGVFVTTLTWEAWIRQAAEELYQLILAQGGEEMMSLTQNFTITSGNSVSLAFDESQLQDQNAFRQLIGVTRDPGTPQRRTVHRYEFAERDSQWMEPRYRLMGHTLFIEPEEQAVGNYQLTYLSGPENWIADDTVAVAPAILGWLQEFIMISAAIKALGKERTATTDLQARLDGIRQDIEDHCGSVDRGEPGKVTDVGDDGSWY